MLLVEIAPKFQAHNGELSVLKIYTSSENWLAIQETFESLPAWDVVENFLATRDFRPLEEHIQTVEKENRSKRVHVASLEVVVSPWRVGFRTPSSGREIWVEPAGGTQKYWRVVVDFSVFRPSQSAAAFLLESRHLEGKKATISAYGGWRDYGFEPGQLILAYDLAKKISDDLTGASRR